jgi:hypothetical protein
LILLIRNLYIPCGYTNDPGHRVFLVYTGA